MLVHIARTIAVFLLLAGAVSLAEDRGTIIEKGKDHFETVFAPGERLELEVQSGEVHISGSDTNKVSIHYEGRQRGDVENVVVHCKKIEGGAELEVSGGPRNDSRFGLRFPGRLSCMCACHLESSTLRRYMEARMSSYTRVR